MESPASLQYQVEKKEGFMRKLNMPEHLVQKLDRRNVSQESVGLRSMQFMDCPSYFFVKGRSQ